MGLSYQRFKAGSSEAFQQGFDEAAEAGGGAPQGYTGGPEDMGGEYGQQPFQGGGGQSGKGFNEITSNPSFHVSFSTDSSQYFGMSVQSQCVQP